MYDVVKRQEELKKIIPMFQEVIDKDELDSAVIIIRKKSGIVEFCSVQGDASSFELVGILECAKEKFKS